MEDRNQEFKSARTDVREMEGSLERVRASIAEVARKLAVYVRARRTLPMMACREEPSNTMTGWRRIRFPRVVPWSAQSVHLEHL